MPFAQFKFPNGNIDFDDASFGDGIVTFQAALFGEGNVSFTNTLFGKGSVRFDDASFGTGNVNFNFASFDGDYVNFANASFGEGDVSFNVIVFYGLANFINLRNVSSIKRFSFAHSTFESSLRISSDEPFGCVLDLTNTKMNNQVSLEGLKCNLRKTKSILGSEWLGGAKARDVGDIARFRRLKEIAGNNKDHEQALNFNAMEMQAKRWHQTTFAGLFFEFIFQKTSDYGRSEFLSFKWMIGLWLVWSGIYYWLSDCMKNSPIEKIKTSMIFSIGQMIPFVPISRAARSDGAELLFPGDQLPNAVIWLASFQSVISIILIFLIGLSLRNRFKV